MELHGRKPVPYYGETIGERFADRHRKAENRAVRPWVAHPATASCNWDYFWHCCLYKRRALLAPLAKLLRFFFQDPASFNFLPEIAKPTGTVLRSCTE